MKGRSRLSSRQAVIDGEGELLLSNPPGSGPLMVELKLLSPSTAAKYFRVDRATVYWWIKLKKLRVVRRRSRLWIPAREFQRVDKLRMEHGKTWLIG